MLNLYLYLYLYRYLHLYMSTHIECNYAEKHIRSTRWLIARHVPCHTYPDGIDKSWGWPIGIFRKVIFEYGNNQFEASLRH